MGQDTGDLITHNYLKDPVFVDKLNNMLENALTEEMQIALHKMYGI